MAVMMEMIMLHGIRPKDVKRVAVGTNHNMPNALIHHKPVNELQAKFSMEFCMAILILERKAGLEQFTDEVVNRPDVQALLQRVDFGVNAEAEAAGFDKMTTIVEVELDDGTAVKGAADFGKGSPANPMSDDELKEKFRQCAAWGGLGAAQTRTVIDLVWRIQTLEDVGELTQHLRTKRME
jgi:2-methylcitrate dehydratase PrpD